MFFPEFLAPKISKKQNNHPHTLPDLNGSPLAGQAGATQCPGNRFFGQGVQGPNSSYLREKETDKPTCFFFPK